MSLAWSFSVLSHKTSHKLFQGKLSQPGRKHGQQVLETLWNHHWQLGFVFTLLTCFQLPLPNTGNVQRRSECQHLGGVRTRYVGRKPNRRSCIPQASVITFCICNRLILSVCMVHLLRIPGDIAKVSLYIVVSIHWSSSLELHRFHNLCAGRKLRTS